MFAKSEDIAAARAALHYGYRGYLLGDPMAGLIIGSWYEQGHPVRKQAATALRWYEAASKMGNFLATDHLAMTYEQGTLGVKDLHWAQHYRNLFLQQVTPPKDAAGVIR